MRKDFIFYTVPDPDGTVFNPDWKNDITMLCRELQTYYGNVAQINLWAYEIGCVSIMALDIETEILENNYSISIAESTAVNIPNITIEKPADNHIYCETKSYSDMFNLAIYICQFLGVTPVLFLPKKMFKDARA